MKKVRLFILFFALSIIMPNVYAAEYKTGTYKIYYAGNENFMLVENNGNIELGDANSTGNTTWDIYSNGTSFYIKSSADNSVSIGINGNLQNKTNISSSKHTGANNQKWQFITTNGQYYFIKSILGNYNIDITNGFVYTGSNIQLYQTNGSIAQKWKLVRIDENPRPLEDGTYTIRTAINQNNLIDLSGAKTNNESNVQTYKTNFSWAQIWNVKYEDGFYKISTYLDSNKLVDISGARYGNENNVQIYQRNGNNAQKWIIQPNDDGTYSILSFDGLWKIDVKGASTASETNIQLFQPNGHIAQNFIFEKAPIELLEDGYYTIDSIIGDNMVVGIKDAKAKNNKNVILTKKTDDRHKKWYIKRMYNDVYTIANAQNKKQMLDVDGAKTANGTNVQLYSYNGCTAQRWIIRKNQDNTFSLYGVGSSKALDISGGNSAEGSNIQIYTPNNSTAQKFNITSIVEDDYEYVEPGKYMLKSILNQNKVIDVDGANREDNTNIQVWENINTKAQIWKVEDVGEGKYILRSLMNTNTVLTATSSNVVLKKYNNSDDQKWHFYKNSQDAYVLYNMGQGRYLNVEGSNSGSNVSLSDVQKDSNGLVLSQYTQSLTYRGVDVSQHNGNIDWATLKNQVDFVVIRAGFSSEVIENGKDKFEDTKFLTNVQNCEKYNIPYGLYLYSYAWNVNGPENSAESEAAHMLALINKAKAYGGPNLDVPIYYDIEDDDYTFKRIGYNGSTFTSMNDRFCSIIESNGYQCGIYTFLNAFDYMGYDNVRNLASKYGMWVAQVKWYNFDPYEYQFAVTYNTDSRYNQSNFAAKYGIKEDIWQYSHQGNMPAANTGAGRIDLNIGYNILG